MRIDAKLFYCVYVVSLCSLFNPQLLKAQTPCSNVNTIDKKVNKKIQKEQYSKAVQILKKYLKKEPECSYTYIKFGDVFSTFNPKESFKYYQIASILEPNNELLKTKKKMVVNQLIETELQRNNYTAAKQLLDKLLLDSKNDPEVVETALQLFIRFATSEYNSGNISSTQAIMGDITELYNANNLIPPCDILVLKGKIFLERAKQNTTSDDLIKESIFFLNEAINLPGNCPPLNQLILSARELKAGYLVKQAEMDYEAGNLDHALEYVTQALAIDVHLAFASEIRKKILFSLSGAHLQKGEYLKSIIYIEELIKDLEINDENVKYFDHYEHCRMAYAKFLIDPKKGNEQYVKNGITILNDLVESKNTYIKQEALKLRKTGYLFLIKSARKRGDFNEAMDYQYRLQMEYPDDTDVLHDRAETIKEFGKYLHKHRQYHYANFYYLWTGTFNQYYKGIADYYLSKLFEANFNIAKAKNYASSVVRNKNTVDTYVRSASYDLQRYNSMLGDAPAVIKKLKSIYCSSEYNSLRLKIKNDNSFYNMQKYSEFRRWINGQRRYYISGIRGKISFDPDADEYFNWWSWKGADLICKVSYEGKVIIQSSYVKGQSNPVWYEDAIFNYKLGDPISFHVYDLDPKLFGKNELEYICTLQEDEICETKRYHLSKKMGNGTVAISYLISDTNDPTYSTYNYIYKEKPGVQIGFELVYCSAKTLLPPIPFLLVTVAELVLIDHAVENNEDAIADAVEKVARKFSTKRLPNNYKAKIKVLGIASCIYKTIRELNKSDWVERHYTSSGETIERII